MNEIAKIIQNADDRTLWKLLSDTAGIIDRCNLSTDDMRVMFWYWIFKAIQTQIDNNLEVEHE